MGSITSRPSVPTQPQIVYVPAPAVKTATQSQTVSNTAQDETEQDNTQSDSQIASEVRRENLLRRDRGRLGTILSGFRGFFTSSESNTRKTLLGE